MSIKSLLLDYVNYNHWANKCIADLLLKLEPPLLDKEIKSSFPTLRKTVHHIWDAELAWTARLKQESVNWPPTQYFKNPAIDEFINTSANFVECIASKDETFINGSTTYKNSKGETFTSPNAGIIMHCMNHSTFHRGQLITMVRELGIVDLPPTDMIVFLRQQK